MRIFVISAQSLPPPFFLAPLLTACAAQMLTPANCHMPCLYSAEYVERFRGNLLGLPAYTGIPRHVDPKTVCVIDILHTRCGVRCVEVSRGCRLSWRLWMCLCVRV